MDTMEIVREAVKIVEKISKETDCVETIPGRPGSSEEQTRYIGKQFEALKALIILATKYIECEDKIPLKFKEVVTSDEYPLSYYEGYNACREECIFTIMKKLYGIEDIINKWAQNKKEINNTGDIKENYRNLALIIKEHILK